MAFAEHIPNGQTGAERSERTLADVAGRVRPVVLAGERRIPVPGDLGALLPGDGLQRGSVVAVDGPPGSGATSLVLSLLAAATAAGEWAAVVDDGSFGALAAAEAGVALERLAVVRGPGARGVPEDADRRRWGRVVAALLDGMTLVATGAPPFLRAPDARRLAARARERAAVLVAIGPWPGEAALRLQASGSAWDGLGWGEGMLAGRSLRVEVGGRGAAGRGGGGEVRIGPGPGPGTGTGAAEREAASVPGSPVRVAS